MLKTKQSIIDTRLIFEELEPRELFSGGLEGVLLADTEIESATYIDINEDSDPGSTLLADIQSSESAVSTERQELVFIDIDVENYQELLNDILAQDLEGRKFEVIVLDNERDGIEQISEALAKYQNLDAVHLISHGSDGSVDIGNTRLDSASLTDNQSSIIGWADSFSEAGDFLIYGCNLAATEDGQSLIDALSGLTEADVAASDDLTGQADLGGDWDLEYTAGEVETAAAVSIQAQMAYEALLAITTVSASGAATASAGGIYTLNLTTDETATSWTINWGDGEIENVVGDPSSVTHTYAAGAVGLTYNILVSATDGTGTYFDNDLIASTAFLTGEGLYRYSNSGVFDQYFSGAELTNPYAMTVGPDGLLYVAGHASDNIVRYNTVTSAYVDTFVAAGSGGLNAATGLTFGADGNLYVSNQIGDSILKFDGSTGAFLSTFVSTGSGGLNEPVHINFRPDGYLYVGSYNTDSVLRYSAATGAYVDTFVSAGSGGLSGPGAIAWGSDGNLYIASTDSTVKRYDGSTGAFIDNFVSTGSGGLGEASGLAFGPDGNLYVSSFSTDQIIKYDGTTGALIGDYVTPGGNGLDGPVGFTFSPSQQVLIVNAPGVAGAGATLAYTEGDSATVIDNTLSITDVDDTNIESATISITGGLVNSEDVLAFVDGNGITGSFNATTGVLSLSGTATLANYEAALESVTYQNTNGNNPNTGNRTVTWVVNDGDTNSAGVTHHYGCRVQRCAHGHQFKRR